MSTTILFVLTSAVTLSLASMNAASNHTSSQTTKHCFSTALTCVYTTILFSYLHYRFGCDALDSASISVAVGLVLLSIQSRWWEIQSATERTTSRSRESKVEDGQAEKLDESLDKLRAEKEEIDAKLADLVKELIDTREELVRCQERLRAVEDILTTRERVIDCLKQQVVEWTRSYSLRTGPVRRHNNELNKLSHEIDEYTKQFDELKGTAR